MREHFLTILSTGYYTSDALFKDMKTSPLRVVQNYELELYTENQGLSYLNELTFHIKQNTLLLAKPGDTRRTALPSSCFFVHFEVNDTKLAEEIDSFSSLVHMPTPQNTKELFDDVISNYASLKHFDNVLATAKVMDLLHTIKEAEGIFTVQPSAHNINHIYQLALQYIDHTYTRSISVEEIATNCSVSTSYLYKVFAKLANTTPNNAILNRRITEAKKLILLKKYTLTEISIMCGFNSPAYFSDAFKRVTGVSPSVYQKENLYINAQD